MRCPTICMACQFSNFGNFHNSFAIRHNFCRQIILTFRQSFCQSLYSPCSYITLFPSSGLVPNTLIIIIIIVTFIVAIQSRWSCNPFWCNIANESFFFFCLFMMEIRRFFPAHHFITTNFVRSRKVRIFFSRTIGMIVLVFLVGIFFVALFLFRDGRRRFDDGGCGFFQWWWSCGSSIFFLWFFFFFLQFLLQSLFQLASFLLKCHVFGIQGQSILIGLESLRGFIRSCCMRTAQTPISLDIRRIQNGGHLGIVTSIV
mmetsp:Transcript_2656/g.2536  ORF Transcript_2656/g.2536 Transcript_2656/m.2536 type:complete len:258 (+) Transcript_2656:174-947(+)